MESRSYSHTANHRHAQDHDPRRGGRVAVRHLRREPQASRDAVRRPHPHERARADRRGRARPTWRAPSRSSTSSPALMRGGYKLAKGDVRTAAQLVAQDESVELADYFLRGAPRTSGKRQVDAEERQPAPLSRRDRAARHRLRHRPGRHRQDVPRDGAGGVVPARQARQPDHPGAAGGRGGREARVPAGRPAGEGQSRTCGRSTTRSTT